MSSIPFREKKLKTAEESTVIMGTAVIAISINFLTNQYRRPKEG